MKRNLAVVGVVVLLVAALVWAGVQNLRARREAAEKAKQIPELAMVKDGEAMPTPTAGADSYVGELDLRGKPAPGFSLTSLEGKKVSLSDYKGKPVLVNFWATWCAPCKLEMPWFEEFQKKYAAQGFVILGVSEDDDQPKEAIAKAATKLGVTYPILLGNPKADKAYGDFSLLPMSFYIDGKGNIVEQAAGLGSKDGIEAKIKKTIAATGAL
ncbi:TlpA disulfide reductase family protein [Terriglobus tenax]|uniref:TlpA disulfide reductase family protein n=1 Tax=Terriglobus tenax TaxID=1111115 RepID=UPI0021E074B1|nr:TlpA disulfide reductase family protein [Terriglobus tenax]